MARWRHQLGRTLHLVRSTPRYVDRLEVSIARSPPRRTPHLARNTHNWFVFPPCFHVSHNCPIHHESRSAGCPDYLRLMTLRAKASNVAFEPPYIPASFLAYVQKEDPVAAPYTLSDASNPFLGKKILVLSGGDDPVVQWECSEAFVKDLEVGSQGAKKVIVYPGVGHECTPAMLKETADFVWDHVLTNSTIQ